MIVKRHEYVKLKVMIQETIIVTILFFVAGIWIYGAYHLYQDIMRLR